MLLATRAREAQKATRRYSLAPQIQLKGPKGSSGKTSSSPCCWNVAVTGAPCCPLAAPPCYAGVARFKCAAHWVLPLVGTHAKLWRGVASVAVLLGSEPRRDAGETGTPPPARPAVSALRPGALRPHSPPPGRQRCHSALGYTMQDDADGALGAPNQSSCELAGRNPTPTRRGQQRRAQASSTRQSFSPYWLHIVNK